MKQVSATRWKVASESILDKQYIVDVTEAGIKCDCMYYQKRKSACKHAKAVESYIIKEATPDKTSKTTINELRLCCPKCKSEEFVKDGKRPRVKREDAQRYKCTDCNYRFTGDIGFRGRHYSPQVIVMVLQLLMMASTLQVSFYMRQTHSITIHPSTIYRWADRYGNQIERFVNTIPINASGKWSTDEKSIRSTKHWLFAVMDTGSKFVLSWDMTWQHKMSYNATNLFANARERAGHRPAILVSDGLKQFMLAFRKIFSTNHNPKTRHFRESHIRSEYSNNNAHERFNGTIRDFIASKRGFKRKKPPCITLFLIHYNFVRPHMGLRKITPAEAAGITINGNKWLTLIQNAALAAQ